jgi:hypothetical protein
MDKSPTHFSLIHSIVLTYVMESKQLSRITILAVEALGIATWQEISKEAIVFLNVEALLLLINTQNIQGAMVMASAELERVCIRAITSHLIPHSITPGV